MATSRAKTKVIKSIKNVGTLEQQRLIILQVLLDPSIRDISSSIGINMKEIKLGQQLLRCARKIIERTKNCPDENGGRCRTSVAKRSVVKALCVSLLPTPTKESSNDGDLINYIQSERHFDETNQQAVGIQLEEWSSKSIFGPKETS